MEKYFSTISKSLQLGLALHFLKLNHIHGIALVPSSDFHPAAVHKHLQEFGSHNAAALCHECPSTQQLKQTVSSVHRQTVPHYKTNNYSDMCPCFYLFCLLFITAGSNWLQGKTKR